MRIFRWAIVLGSFALAWPAQAWVVQYADDFDDGVVDAWEPLPVYDFPLPNLEETEGSLRLYTSWGRAGLINWDSVADFRIRGRFEMPPPNSSAIAINFRTDNAAYMSGYQLVMTLGGIYQVRRDNGVWAQGQELVDYAIPPPSAGIDPPWSFDFAPYPFDAYVDAPEMIEIEGIGSRFRIWLWTGEQRPDAPFFEFEDDTYASGGFGFDAVSWPTWLDHFQLETSPVVIPEPSSVASLVMIGVLLGLPELAMRRRRSA